MDWMPIDSAPKDGSLIRLRSQAHAPAELFHWNKRTRRWETEVFAIAAKYTGWWSENAQPPTHWLPIEQPNG